MNLPKKVIQHYLNHFCIDLNCIESKIELNMQDEEIFDNLELKELFKNEDTLTRVRDEYIALLYECKNKEN